jgi:hypothetical protein
MIAAMTRVHARSAVVFSLVSLLVGASCGGGDDDEPRPDGAGPVADGGRGDGGGGGGPDGTRSTKRSSARK